ncbi:MAG TPA: sensor histidine kinase [Pseudonocardia sp.]
MPRPALSARLALPALAAAVIQVAGTLGATNHQPAARPLDVAGVALLLAGPAALLARRRAPIGTLLATLAVLLGYLAAGYPYGPCVVALVFALVSAVVRRRKPAWVIAGVAYLGLVATEWVRQGPPGAWVLSGVAAWLLLILTAGELVRVRTERLAWARREREDAARRVATEERLRIARDLHDVLAHHVSLINVQAGTALHLLDEQPGLAREALTTIKASSKEVLVELRTMLGVLRRVDEEAPRAPTAGLEGLGRLVGRMVSSGLPVTVLRDGIPRPLPAAVDTAAYRIVQEALTNVHRHAGEATATVLVGYTGTEVVVQVDDDGGAGTGQDNDSGTGNGIPGMRERAAALGGRLEAGRRPGGGFRVRAELPAPRGGEPG